MSPRPPRLSLSDVLERLAQGLPHARWAFDDDADELEIVLPGGDGHEGRAVLINDEYYLRLDVDTNAPLSIVIPTVSVWLGRQLETLTRSVAVPPPADVRQPWTADSQQAVVSALRHSVRASGDLAAAVA